MIYFFVQGKLADITFKPGGKSGAIWRKGLDGSLRSWIVLPYLGTQTLGIALAVKTSFFGKVLEKTAMNEA